MIGPSRWPKKLASLEASFFEPAVHGFTSAATIVLLAVVSSPTPPLSVDASGPPPPPRLCANCGTALTGHYCAHCGQHDVEYCRTFRHFAEEVVENLFHFEGKFLVSVAWLMAKPGRLTNEFIAGRRQSQLNPLRFYVFATVLFFLGVHLLNHGHLIDINRRDVDALANGYNARSGEWFVGHQLTSAQKREVRQRIKQAEGDGGVLDLTAINAIIRDVQKELPGVPANPAALDPGNRNASLGKSPTESPNWANRVVRGLGDKFRSGDLTISDLLDELEHRVPTMLFLGMPVFALILKLLYFRRRRFYLEHLIFSLHLHTWLFLAVMVGTGYVGLAGLIGPLAATTMTWGIVGWMVWYVAGSFRAVYGQSWAPAALTAAVATLVYNGALFVIAVGLVAGTIVWIALE